MSEYVINVNSNKTLTAVYVEQLTTVVLTAVAGSGGTVTPSGAQTLNVGQLYQFTETPAQGFVFDHWDLAGTSKGSSPILSLTATADMNGQTLTAIFTTQPPQQVTVTLAVTGNGSVNPAVGSQTFNVGDTVTITAIPQTGTAFNGWKLNGAPYSTANPLDLVVTADLNGKTLNADFTTTPIQAGFPLWALIPVGAVGAWYLLKGDKHKKK